MKISWLAGLVLSAVSTVSLFAADRSWENPIFDTAQEAVAAARANLHETDANGPAALQFFVDLTLAEGDLDRRHPSSSTARQLVDDFLVTYPSAFLQNNAQRRTVERFLGEVPRQRTVLEGRLARFGYPDLSGLVYLRLVESVDAFSSLNRASSDKMSRVGGVTYYCRYVVLPLSYVSREGLEELRRSGALNPSTDIEGTIRQWQNESYANLVNTFRHELVHVHTNSALGVPVYSNRSAYPTWFHEGTATYLAADPHAGLSRGYQEFQGLFFYLVQRHGVAKLQRFFAGVLGGSDVLTTLREVYAISGSEQLFDSSRRWNRVKELLKTGFWIVGLLIVINAFRGADRPYIGALQILAAVALGLATATGLAEHLYGLRGPGVVLAVKTGLWLITAAVGIVGVRRIRRHGRIHAD